MKTRTIEFQGRSMWRGVVRVIRRRIVPCAGERLRSVGLYTAPWTVLTSIPIRSILHLKLRHRVSEGVVYRSISASGRDLQPI